MNNSEAKRVILEADSCFCKHGAYKDCHSGCKYREALDAAVKALEQEPFKNDLGVDCISRQAVIDICDKYNGQGYVWGAIKNDIQHMPSVTPQEPKTGEWIEQNDDYFDWYECSECGYGSEGEMQYSSEYDVRTNYCPNCGAKMVEPQESESDA